MYKISEHSLLYIVSLFTTPSLMGTGKGSYKRRSSSLLHIHMCTSMFTHTQMDAHTHTHSGLYALKQGGSQPS